MLGILQAFDYQDWLIRQQKTHKSAINTNKKECLHCGFCCLRRPCLPTPKEVKKIAEFLGLKVQKMVQTLFVADAYEADGVKFIFPAKTSQKDITGEYIDASRTFDKGYCIFHDKKKRQCKIYPVQPKAAKIYGCWRKNEKEEQKHKDATLKKWANVNINDFGIEED